MLPTLSATDQIRVQRVKCSVMDSDLSNCRTQLDAMDPTSRQTAVRDTEGRHASLFETEVNLIKTAKEAAIQNSLDHLDKVLVSNKSLEKQMAELTAQKKVQETEKQNLEQSIRAHRRRFLDNDPQEGTPAILGLRTSDDKVLLFFWIALLILVNLGIFAYFAFLKRSHIPIVYIGATVGVFAIAYLILFNATRIKYKVRSTTL